MRAADPARRRFLGLAAAFALAPARPSRAAVSVAEARAFVEATIAELFEIARSGAGKARQREAFRALLVRRMAMEPAARTILGPTWRSISKDERAAYLDAFEEYVAQKYGTRFDEFTQVKIEIVRTKDLGERGVVVETRASLPSGETAQIDWGVTDRGGRVQIANIVVEGVSLITSEKEIVAGLLDRNGGDIGKVIAALRAGG